MTRFVTRIAGVIAVTGLVTSAFAQAPADPLAQAKALRRIADQKAEADVRDALAAAGKVAKASPTTARQQLQQTLLTLDLSTEISADKRKELVTLVEAQLAGMRSPAVNPSADPKAVARRAETRKVVEAYLAEAKDVRDGLAEVARLDAQKRSAEALAKVAALAQKYPQNPSILALTGRGTMAERVAAAHELAREQNDRVLYVFNDVARTALPPKGDVEYPPNWKELSEKRLQAEKLDPRTEAILTALEKPVSKGANDLPFEEAVQLVSNLVDQPLYLDKKAMEDAGLDMKRPVSIPGGVTARTALRAVLQSLGLTYIIKDGVIQVVTLDQAKATLVTRSYYLGDVLANGPFSGSVRWGPLVDFEQTSRNAEMIVEAVTKSVDPMVWSTGMGRGPATIFYHAPSLSLVIRAPTEVHAAITGKLRR